MPSKSCQIGIVSCAAATQEPRMPLKVCFISSEVTPLSKTGGLADVAGALAKHLHGARHDVRVFSPLYAQIDRRQWPVEPVSGLQDIPLDIGPHRYRYSVLVTQLPGSKAPVYLIDCASLYARSSLYTADADEHLRFLALTRAAFEISQRMAWSPDILHCNDWHAGFAPLYLKYMYSWDRLFQRTRSVLTIHNIGYQGVFSASAVDDLALGPNIYLLHQDDLRAGHINSLKHGIMYADAITTVSPTYAREIRTREQGMGLQTMLQQRSGALVGILNGVDYDEWDPRRDRYLSRHYDARQLANKLVLKAEFLKRLGLSTSPSTPLAGLVSRLAMQKGLDLLFDALPRVLSSRELAFVALGSGEPQYENFFLELQQNFRGRVHFHRGYSDELAHWIEAASDMFLMPSLYEPCGLNQLYSLRYGTVPVVRKTGGLADSVQPFDPATKQGTGIVFEEFKSEALARALNEALDLYSRQSQWRQMVRNGMRQNFSWAHQGAEYVKLYERVLNAA
jgi:starch synthase